MCWDDSKERKKKKHELKFLIEEKQKHLGSIKIPLPMTTKW